MRYTKGKWIASYRDTYSLDYTLSPIIYAGLSKFHEVLEKRNKEGGCLGVPNEYMKDESEWVTDSDVQDWLDDIKKMMYAFENNEPDIRDYNFKLTTVPYEDETTKSYEPKYGKSFKIECDNEEEKLRYYADLDAHKIKVQEGLELTFKNWTNLWW
jgi:hypothetical protein